VLFTDIVRDAIRVAGAFFQRSFLDFSHRVGDNACSIIRAFRKTGLKELGDDIQRHRGNHIKSEQKANGSCHGIRWDGRWCGGVLIGKLEQHHPQSK
jgi:hypothetical protein